MSDRAGAILAALSDEGQTTDEIIEATGFERIAVAQDLAALKAAGRAYSGRGGWRLSDSAPAAKVKRHEAVEPAPVRVRFGRPKGRRTGIPSVPRMPRPTVDASPASRYIYGMSEFGELTVTDRADEAKQVRLSSVDTARLALLFKRWAPLLIEAA